MRVVVVRSNIFTTTEKNVHLPGIGFFLKELALADGSG
jgi:hypothetical protein